MRKSRFLSASAVAGVVCSFLMPGGAVAESGSAQHLQGVLDAITRDVRVPAKAEPPVRPAIPPVALPEVPVRAERDAVARPEPRVPAKPRLEEAGGGSANAEALRPILEGSAPSPIAGPAPEPTPATLSVDEVARIQALIEADVAAQKRRQPPTAWAPRQALPLQETHVAPRQHEPPREATPAPEASPEKTGFLGKLFGRKGPVTGGTKQVHPNAALVSTQNVGRVAAVEPPVSRVGGAVSPARPAAAPNRDVLENLLGDSRLEAEAAAKAPEAAAGSSAIGDVWQEQGASAYRYQGEWLNGEMHGYGKLQYRDGWEYVGTWVQGAMDGQGRLVQADGSVYEGGWKAGRMHGLGKLTYPDGWTFTGQWKDGRISGQGELVAPGK